MSKMEQERYPEQVEDEIYLLHQLEETILQIIAEEQRCSGDERVVAAWRVLTNLMPEYKTFYSLGVKPYKARGLIAEIMARILFEEWAKKRHIEYTYASNILIPRADRGTTQIDSVFITKRISAVIECKSFHGKMSIDNGVVKGIAKSTEPWKQNYGHIISLKNIFEDQLQLYFHNILYIFSEGVITEYNAYPDEYLMVNKVAFSLLDDIYDNSKYSSNLSDNDMQVAKDVLAQYIPTVEQEAEHIQFVKTLVGTAL